MNKVIFQQQVFSHQTDYVGHLNNIIYIEWMEIGRTKLLEYIDLSFDKLDVENIAPILVGTEIKYKKSLYLNEMVKIEIWVSELKNASAVMSFNFYNSKGELAAFGKQTGLFIHRDTLKPYRLKSEHREAFLKVTIEE